MKPKVIIVTGAASGIGLELTRQLLLKGHKVCACDINEKALVQHFNTNHSVLLKPLDIRDPKQWQSFVADVIERWGRIDVLCNVAGVLKENWVSDITPEDVDLHFDINVKGTIYGTQSVLGVMKSQGNGHIINIASLAALTAVPGLSLYSASKFAVRSYSIAAAIELSEFGIAVTAICPDGVQTPMLDAQKGKPQAALTFSGGHALTPQEVVHTIIDKVIPHRPIEVILPFERGVIAKLANAFPQQSVKLSKLLQKKGMKRQDFNH